MQYLLLIYADPDQVDTPELMSEYGTFTNEVAGSGALKTGLQIERAPRARTVSVRDGKTVTTDGPYAETKEQIGGFYVLECPTMDDAVALAARIPSARDGYIEVRPVIG